MARKNQMANGMAANIPGSAEAAEAVRARPAVSGEVAPGEAGATTPMNTSSSKMASRVTISSKVAAMPTPRILSVIKIT